MTTGIPALIASSTASPKPSFTDGKASTSAAAYQAGMSTSGTVPTQHDVVVRARDRARGSSASTPLAVGPVVLEGVTADDGQHGRRRRGRDFISASARDQGVAALARLDAADGQDQRAGSAAPTCARSCAARSGPATTNRARSTPLGTTWRPTP